MKPLLGNVASWPWRTTPKLEIAREIGRHARDRGRLLYVFQRGDWLDLRDQLEPADGWLFTIGPRTHVPAILALLKDEVSITVPIGFLRGQRHPDGALHERIVTLLKLAPHCAHDLARATGERYSSVKANLSILRHRGRVRVLPDVVLLKGRRRVMLYGLAA